MISHCHADESVDVVIVRNALVACVVGNENELMPESTHEDGGGNIPSLVEEEDHDGENGRYSGNFTEISPVIAIVETLAFQFGGEVME